MTSHSRSFLSASRRRRSQAGAAIVETLIFIPTIFIMTFITLEVTNAMLVYEQISWVAEYGVRQASEGMDNSDQRLRPENVKDNIRNKLLILFPFRDVLSSKMCVEYNDDGGEPQFCNKSDDPGYTSAKPGDLVRVTVEMPYNPIFKIRLIPDLTISSTFRRVISGSAAG